MRPAGDHGLNRIGVLAEAQHRPSILLGSSGRPFVVDVSLVDCDHLALEIIERFQVGRVFLDQESIVRVHIALDEQHALGALGGDRRRGHDEVVFLRVEPGEDAGPLLVHDLDVHAQTASDLIDHVHVVAFVAAGRFRHHVRRESHIRRHDKLGREGRRIHQ